MSYATTSDMVTRYDVLRLGELVRDDGSRATAAELVNDTNLQAVLADAAGLIDAALLVGKRYNLADLDKLMDAADPDYDARNTKFLIRINCGLAYGLLLQRKGYPADSIANLAPGYVEAQQWLERLANGDMVFNIEAIKEAGTVEPTVVLSDSLRLVTSSYRYFGYLGQSTRSDRQD